MILLRRFLALTALLFWQGGGTFFAGVAILIGRRVLHDQLHLQNLITRDATAWINRLGIGALLLLAWDIAFDPSRLRRRLRTALWLATAATVVALFPLHAQLA